MSLNTNTIANTNTNLIMNLYEVREHVDVQERIQTAEVQYKKENRLQVLNERKKASCQCSVKEREQIADV
jgi:hypothetical protein